MDWSETLELFRKGKDSWNQWAKDMLAKRNALKQNGQWSVERGKDSIEEGKNIETQRWIANADVNIRIDSGCFADSDLCKLIFPHDIRIDCFKSGTLKFNEAEIFGSVRGAIIYTCHADFGAATFFEDFILFEDINASFNEAKFYGLAVFDRAGSTGEFKGAHFRREARFAKIEFFRGAHFERAHFDNIAVFEGAVFKTEANFEEALFKSSAVFERALFETDANFNGALFKSSTDFRARFEGGRAHFNGVRFAGIRFDSVNFERGAEFKNAQFSGDANFGQAKFGRSTTFQEARFRKAATFTDIEARAGFSFVDATFTKLPRINGAHFEKLPLLDGMKLESSAEPGGLFRSIFKKVKEDVPVSYRELKNYAVRAGHLRNEQAFFRGELRSRRNREDKFWHPAFWLGISYELFSDLGKSLSRPIAWWLALMAASAWLYLMPLRSAGATACVAGKGDPVMSAILLALKKGVILGGLDGAGKDGQIYACLYGLTEGFGSAHGVKDLVPAVPDWVAMYGLAQTALSAALLFLFLLALRNHFRIR